MLVHSRNKPLRETTTKKNQYLRDWQGMKELNLLYQAWKIKAERTDMLPFYNIHYFLEKSSFISSVTDL